MHPAIKEWQKQAAVDRLQVGLISIVLLSPLFRCSVLPGWSTPLHECSASTSLYQGCCQYRGESCRRLEVLARTRAYIVTTYHWCVYRASAVCSRRNGGSTHSSEEGCRLSFRGSMFWPYLLRISEDTSSATGGCLARFPCRTAQIRFPRTNRAISTLY